MKRSQGIGILLMASMFAMGTVAGLATDAKASVIKPGSQKEKVFNYGTMAVPYAIVP